MPTIMSKIAKESNDPLLHLHENYGVSIHYLWELCGKSDNYRSLIKNTLEHTMPNIDDEIDIEYYNSDELSDWINTSEEVIKYNYMAAMKKIQTERKKLEEYNRREKQKKEFDLEKVKDLCDDVQRHIFGYLPYDLQAGVHMHNWSIIKKRLNYITTTESLHFICKHIEKNYYERPRRRAINNHVKKFEPGRKSREMRQIYRLWERSTNPTEAQICVDFRNLTLKSVTKKSRLYDLECLIRLLINAGASRKGGLYNSAKKMHYIGFKLVKLLRYYTL